MKLNFRYSLAIALTVLILFSTIGFNIIVSFCGGCESEHINISLTADTSDECSCCKANDKTFHCCTSKTKHTHDHHKKKNFLAQLKYDSTEAKGKLLKVVLPVNNFFAVSSLIPTFKPASSLVGYLLSSLPPPQKGRTILLFNCILRN